MYIYNISPTLISTLQGSQGSKVLGDYSSNENTEKIREQFVEELEEKSKKVKIIDKVDKLYTKVSRRNERDEAFKYMKANLSAKKIENRLLNESYNEGESDFNQITAEEYEEMLISILDEEKSNYGIEVFDE